jgi:hypothetical protein
MVQGTGTGSVVRGVATSQSWMFFYRKIAPVITGQQQILANFLIWTTFLHSTEATNG